MNVYHYTLALMSVSHLLISFSPGQKLVIACASVPVVATCMHAKLIKDTDTYPRVDAATESRIQSILERERVPQAHAIKVYLKNLNQKEAAVFYSPEGPAIGLNPEYGYQLSLRHMTPNDRGIITHEAAHIKQHHLLLFNTLIAYMIYGSIEAAYTFAPRSTRAFACTLSLAMASMHALVPALNRYAELMADDAIIQKDELEASVARFCDNETPSPAHKNLWKTITATHPPRHVRKQRFERRLQEMRD